MVKLVMPIDPCLQSYARSLIPPVGFSQDENGKSHRLPHTGIVVIEDSSTPSPTSTGTYAIDFAGPGIRAASAPAIALTPSAIGLNINRSSDGSYLVIQWNALASGFGLELQESAELLPQSLSTVETEILFADGLAYATLPLPDDDRRFYVLGHPLSLLKDP